MKKNRPHNEAWWALVIQGVSLILLTPIVWFVKDEFVAGSMLLGGLACLIPNVCLYANVFRYFGAQHAHKMVRALYFGELVKLFLTAGIFAFLAVFMDSKWLNWIKPLYLFVGYFCAQLVFWIVPIFWGFRRQ